MLLLAAVAVAVYAFYASDSVTDDPARGPAYDLVFGVYTYDPDLQSRVTLSPYLIDGTLHLQAEKLPADQGTVSTWIALYRYNHTTGVAEPLPSPTASELQHIEGKQELLVSATKHLNLDQKETSPDGFSLADPAWVPVNFIHNALGNILLLCLSGHTQTITERESTPRLAKGEESIRIRSAAPLLDNEADNAFLLGWVVPEGPATPTP